MSLLQRDCLTLPQQTCMANGTDSFHWKQALVDLRLLEQVCHAWYPDTSPANVLASPFCEQGFANSTLPGVCLSALHKDLSRLMAHWPSGLL